MSEHRGLLNAVYAAPHDDAPRLILADWLGENRFTQGESIARNRDLFTMCRWEQLLNCFEWPPDFLLPRPKEWDGLTRRGKHDLEGYRLVMAAVDTLVTARDTLVYWNQVYRAAMDDQDFNAWWRTNHDLGGSVRGSTKARMLRQFNFRTAYPPQSTANQDKTIGEMEVDETGFIVSWAVLNGAVNESYPVREAAGGTFDTVIVALGRHVYRVNGRAVEGSSSWRPTSRDRDRVEAQRMRLLYGETRADRR